MTEYAYRDVSRLGPYREDPLRHYGLAVDISREFTCSGLERSDLEQEALTALCAAARTFDPDLGNAFSTWAGRVIRGHLSGLVFLYRRVGSIGGRDRRMLSPTEAPSGVRQRGPREVLVAASGDEPLADVSTVGLLRGDDVVLAARGLP
jgi:hypothetical protein